MPTRSLAETMSALESVLDDLDKIARIAHAKYRAYSADVLLELDGRAQAACTFAHMSAEADRRFLGRAGIRDLDIRGLRLWLFEDANAAVRLKKMDEDGLTKNYPTEQARDFDRGHDIPGLPMPPVRLTAGYLLDSPTRTQFIRTQVARPIGRKRTLWCAAIVPLDDRRAEDRAWKDVTRQGSL